MLAENDDCSKGDVRLCKLEIAGLDLNRTELVTLSACETGLGAVAGGEGVLGLQRAIQVAGARTTVTSLWKVDDKATEALMTEFYNNLWTKKLRPLESLRQAQLKMLTSYDPKGGKLRGTVRERTEAAEPAEPATPSAAKQRLSPFYWAAFVVSGDWR